MKYDYNLLKEKIINNYAKLAKSAEEFLSGIEPNKLAIKNYPNIHHAICDILLELYDIDEIETKEKEEYMLYCKRFDELAEIYVDVIKKVYD